MKNTNILKRGMAIILCLVLITISNANMVKAETINTSSLSSNATIFNEEVANNSEVALINKLANEYYNYFVLNGVTQEDVKDMIKSTSNDTLLDSPSLSNNKNNYFIINPTNSILSEGVLDYSVLVKQVTGYTYSLNQIASQLASIGILMNLTSALPFLEFLALIVGGVIVTLVIAIAYAAIAVSVNDLILTWYAYSGVNLTAARLNTIAIVEQEKNGARYWRAYLADYNGLGGITVGDPIAYPIAEEIVLLNNMLFNVFAMHYSDAAYLATYAYGNGFIGPEAHRRDGKILNMQHVHALLINGAHGKCHIFFALPSVA